MRLARPNYLVRPIITFAWGPQSCRSTRDVKSKKNIEELILGHFVLCCFANFYIIYIIRLGIKDMVQLVLNFFFLNYLYLKDLKF